MSRYSGRCDLHDTIGGLGGWYDVNGNPVKFNTPGVGAYYSDEMQDFLEFKKRTGGVMYQHLRVEVTQYNQDFIETKCDNFKVIEHVSEVPDKRVKGGVKKVTSYTYEYYGKEYKNLKELNKHHVYIVKEIHFNTLLDIIPYYPYVVAAEAWSGEKATIFLADRSFVDEEEERALQNGYERTLTDYYRRELQEHYLDVVLTYFNPAGRECIEEVEFGPNLRGTLSNDADVNFIRPIAWYFEDGPKSHWTSPKLVSSNVVEISKQDYDSYLGHKVKVKYIKAFPKDYKNIKLD